MSKYSYEIGDERFLTWVKCVYSLSLRAYEAKMKFAWRIKDPIVKALMLTIAMEFRKVSEILKAAFNLDKPINIYSKECRESLGEQIGEFIAKHALKAPAILIGKGTDRKSIEEFMLELRNVNGLVKSILKLIASVSKTPYSKILTMLIEMLDRNLAFIEKYLLKK